MKYIFSHLYWETTTKVILLNRRLNKSLHYFHFDQRKRHAETISMECDAKEKETSKTFIIIIKTTMQLAKNENNYNFFQRHIDGNDITRNNS